MVHGQDCFPWAGGRWEGVKQGSGPGPQGVIPMLGAGNLEVLGWAMVRSMRPERGQPGGGIG